MAYNNDNTGALFKNDRKVKEQHPDARGEATVTCPNCKQTGVFWLSAWTKIIKQGPKQGNKMQSLSFTPKDDQPVKREDQDTGDNLDNLDDDIPFD